MSETSPESAPPSPGQATPVQSADLAAIAAYGAWIDQTDTARVLLSWSQRPESDRVTFRAIADAVRMAIDLEHAPQRLADGNARLRKERDEARADRDDYAVRLRAVDESWAKLAAERDRLRETVSEVPKLLGHAEWAERMLGESDAEIARLRALLGQALAPCAVCAQCHMPADRAAGLRKSAGLEG